MKNAEQNILALQYELPEELDIYNKKELLKFQHCTKFGHKKVKKLNIYLDDNSNDAANLIESIGTLHEKSQAQ